MSQPDAEHRDSRPASELDTLAGMPVFGGVSADALDFLLRRATRIQVPLGGYFFREGAPGDTMFVLLQGAVEVYRNAADGHCDILRRLGRGDCFGEMALLDLYPRSASVEAIEDSVALGIAPDLLYELYNQSPEPFTIIMMNLARELSRRLRVADERLSRAEGGWSGPVRTGAGEHSLLYI